MKTAKEILSDCFLGVIDFNEEAALAAMERYAKSYHRSKIKKFSFNPSIIGCFRKKEFIEVFCKKCGEKFSYNAEYEPVFANKQDAINSIEMDDNWLVKGDDAFCKSCR